MKERFCPKCGATEKPFIRGFCRDCFLETHPLVDFPMETQLTQCRECGRVLGNGKWSSFSAERMLEWAKSKVKVKDLFDVRILLEPPVSEGGQFLVSGKVLGEIDGELLEFPFSLSLGFRQSLCSDCSKLSANYYEAVLQLRFESLPKKEWFSVLENAEESLGALFRSDPLAKITQRRQLKNGFDLYLGSKRAGKQLAEKLGREYKGKITRSFSLAGVDKSGKEKKRYTFLVRI